MKTINELLQNIKLTREEILGDIDISTYSKLFVNASNSDLNYFNKENVKEILGDIIDQQENFIYYAQAMEFLADDDPTLIFAFELAAEFGYELKYLNSCKLANLVVEHDLNEQLDDCINEIMELIAEELEGA